MQTIINICWFYFLSIFQFCSNLPLLLHPHCLHPNPTLIYTTAHSHRIPTPPPIYTSLLLSVWYFSKREFDHITLCFQNIKGFPLLLEQSPVLTRISPSLHSLALHSFFSFTPFSPATGAFSNLLKGTTYRAATGPLHRFFFNGLLPSPCYPNTN